MSTVPPPYRYDPKADRHAARLQAKAQAQAYKAQRALYRQQTRHLRRGSILGPLLLTGFGIVALFVVTGRWSALSFANAYSRWWPALLVLAGLVLLAEWAFDHYIAQNSIQRTAAGTPPMRRRLGGGIVTVLILIVIFGATTRTVHDQHDFFSNAFSINHDNYLQLFNDKRNLPPQILDQALPTLTPGLVLSVVNPHGDIHITGKSPDGNLHIIVNKQVYASDSNVQAKGDQLTPIFIASPAGLSLSVPGVDAGSADLTLLVPDTLALSLSASHGDISVTGLHAAVALTSNHGDVDLESITGSVTARINRRDTDFSAHHLTGDLNLKGDVGDLTLTDISGQTYLEGTFYGDIHFERLLGPLTFQSTHTHLTLARLNGNLDIDTSNISGSQLVGPINLRVNSRNISFDHIAGDLDLTNSNGSVDITSSLPGNLAITNTNGPIDLTLPDHAGYAISAATDGTIDDDFALPTTKSGGQTTLTGTTGDGHNHINLRTTHASISLQKGPPPPPTP